MSECYCLILQKKVVFEFGDNIFFMRMTWRHLFLTAIIKYRLETANIAWKLSWRYIKYLMPKISPNLTQVL